MSAEMAGVDPLSSPEDSPQLLADPTVHPGVRAL